jgi:uncharacterized membrane protein
MDPQNNQNQTQQQNSSSTPQSNMPQHTTASDNTMVMSVLAYIGPLVIVSYLVDKDNPVVKFHIKQGVALFGAEIIVGIVASILWQLYFVWDIVNLLLLILSIVGIMNASQNKQKELPVIGGFAKGLNF